MRAENESPTMQLHCKRLLYWTTEWSGFQRSLKDQLKALKDQLKSCKMNHRPAKRDEKCLLQGV